MTTIKLNDLQLVLLSAAAQRADGSLLPPPDHLADQAARIRKVIPPLIKHGLVEEAPTGDTAKIWREEGTQRFALLITEAGRSRLGVTNSEPEQSLAAEPSTPPGSKIALVTEMLKRTEGASLDELVSATGWLPHSTRAALTGLRKKGHSITLDKGSKRSCYRLVESAGA